MAGSCCHPTEVEGVGLRCKESLLSNIKHFGVSGLVSMEVRVEITSQNMVSRPETVAKYIAEELEQGRLVEVTADKLEGLKVHLRWLGVIPKKSNPSKWRLIVDLSP